MPDHRTSESLPRDRARIPPLRTPILTRFVRGIRGPVTLRDVPLTRLQGAYYILTGLWSLLHYRSFEVVSGRKREPWLVRTVGLLAVAVGIGLVRNAGSRAGREFADSSAASFAIADLLAVRSGQSRIYLADAAVECLLIAGRRIGIGRAQHGIGSA